MQTMGLTLTCALEQIMSTWPRASVKHLYTYQSIYASNKLLYIYTLGMAKNVESKSHQDFDFFAHIIFIDIKRLSLISA